MKSIKLYEEIKIVYKDEVKFTKNFPNLWKLFNWDIENNKEQDEFAKMIVREMICFGDCDLKDVDGNTIHLEIVPCKESEIDY